MADPGFEARRWWLMQSIEELLDRSASLHGHLCPGQVLGVRMAMLGCELVGIEEPNETRDLMVYVEIDRCATDAIQAVTACKLGKRTLKYKDYGKLAATFLNLASGVAYRVAARDDSREAARRYAPEGSDKKTAQLCAYEAMPLHQLFNVVPVMV
jgi:formylmethanofuran dehydrogenase subunit E